MLIHTSKSRALQRRHPGHLIEIDYSSALARGLEVLIDSGSRTDLVHRQMSTIVGSVVQSVGNYGPALACAAVDSNSGVIGVAKSTIGAGPMSEFALLEYVPASLNQYACGTYNGTIGTGAGLLCEVGGNANKWGALDNSAILDSGVLLQRGVQSLIVHTRDGTNHRLYTNGKLSNTVAGASSNIVAASFNQCTLLNGYSSWSSISPIYYSGRYNRTLDQAEVRDLYNYPWAWARKLPHIFAVTDNTGGDSQLVLSDAAHSHTTDAITLSSASSLSVADATHGHFADASNVASASSLSVADSSHAHAADQSDVYVGLTLTVNDTSHSHTADSANVISASALAVSDATHAHTADQSDVYVGQSLAISDATHGHTADSVSIYSSQSLAISDATHSHGSENAGLYFGTSLTIDDAIHAHAAETFSLDQSITLEINDCAHGHAADSQIMSAELTLLVSDLLHAHVCDNAALVDDSLVSALLDSQLQRSEFFRRTDYRLFFRR